MSYSSKSKTRLPGVPNNVKPKGSKIEKKTPIENQIIKINYSVIEELLLKEDPLDISK